MHSMNSPSERLKHARSRAGYKSAAEAADAWDWSYPTYSAHENGSRGITTSAALRYAVAFKVTAPWILLGEDPPPDRVEMGEGAPDGKDMVPVYDVAASAGFGALVDYEQQTHSLAFPPDYLRKLTAGSINSLVIISVKGESMNPTLQDDDIVLVDTSKTHLGYEGMFVLRHNETLLVKRASMGSRNGLVNLISDNPAYPATEVEIAEITVVGKVIWYGRKV